MRSIEEWWFGHRLLMTAVGNGDIPGTVHFEASLSHWYFSLYSPSRHFSLGCADWEVIKRCAYEAKSAGVISAPEAVFAAVAGGQDLSQAVARLENAGQSMLSMLSKVFVLQAEADAELQLLGKELTRLDRVQKINALLTAIFSFAPLGGAAAANAITAVGNAVPLLESILGTSVALQGVVSPFLLDRFISKASSIVSPEGWEHVTPENKVAITEAAENLGMSWGKFCDMVMEAARQRSLMSPTGGEGEVCGSSGEPARVEDVPEIAEGSETLPLASAPSDGDTNDFPCLDAQLSSAAASEAKVNKLVEEVAELKTTVTELVCIVERLSLNSGSR